MKRLAKDIARLPPLLCLMVAGPCWAETAVQAWAQRYSHNSQDAIDQANCLAIDRNGDVVVAGFSDNRSSGQDMVTIKYSSSGLPLWTNRYDGTASRNDFVQAVAIDSA